MFLDDLFYIKYHALLGYTKIYVEGRDHKKYLRGLRKELYKTLRIYYYNSNALEIFCFKK